MSEHNGIATRDEGDAATDRFDILFENASTYLNDEDCKAIEEAYLFAKGAHEGQFRKSGRAVHHASRRSRDHPVRPSHG